MNLLETTLSLMGVGQIIGICLLVLGWQHHWLLTFEQMISGLSNTIMMVHQFQSYVEAAKPLICSLPSKRKDDTIYLAEIPVFKLYEQKWVFYQFIQDEELKSKPCLDYEQQMYWNQRAFELGDCMLTRKSPFIYRVVKMELSWMKKNNHYQVSLKQLGGNPQVMVSGFTRFAIKWDGVQSVRLMLTWPHFPSVHWVQHLCS